MRGCWLVSSGLLVLVLAVWARGQEASPSLPGAVTKAPDWLGGEVPFDVARYLAAPPPAENAAPLYLEAFFEFSSEMAVCFPAGPDRDRRAQAAQERAQRHREIEEGLRKNPSTPPRAEIDALLASYDAGLHKLAEAQGWPRCVFSTSLGVLTPLPHLQAARQVAHVLKLKLRRELERGEVDLALSDIAATLRLARDLQPRGVGISQIVAVALVGLCHEEMILPVLASPALQPEHCDRLTKLLAEHDTQTIDGLSEAIRGEYLMIRSVIQDATRRQREFARGLEESGLGSGFSVVGGLLLMSGQQVDHPGDSRLKALDTRLAKLPDSEIARVVGQLNSHYRALLALSDLPEVEWARQVPRPRQSLTTEGPLTQVVLMVLPDDVPIGQALARMKATSRASTCLATLRRWELTQSTPPPDLATALQAAGLPSVPADPFDGQPLRLARRNSDLLVYSVGKDGRDDHGQVDSQADRQPGDLLYRLPPRPR